jgi:hypothetical protein
MKMKETKTIIAAPGTQTRTKRDANRGANRTARLDTPERPVKIAASLPDLPAKSDLDQANQQQPFLSNTTP